jgi:AcrR family transcriptional regulator
MEDRGDRRRYHHGDLRAAILEAAERGLSARGAAQLSLRDLAREVGVSHAAPRRHFAERQDLLDALAEAGYARLGERIRQAAADDGRRFAVRVRGAAGAFARFATESPALVELMNSAKQRPGASGVARSSAAAFEPIVGLIREGQAEGVLRGGPPEELGLILYATIAGIATLVTTGAIGGERLDDLTGAAVDQFLRGAS